MNRDIERVVSSCAQCQIHQPSASNEPLMQRDVPPRPWHTLSSDLFLWEQNHYLLVADAFSKFRIVRKLHTISSRSVIKHLKGMFCIRQWPTVLIRRVETVCHKLWIRARNILANVSTIKWICRKNGANSKTALHKGMREWSRPTPGHVAPAYRSN